MSCEPCIQASQVSEMFDGENNTETGAYNRKEKSLGELCRRFLFLYGTPQKGRLYLDQCTRELGVERRRIYDIINILESFSVIERDIKNEYVWRGIDKIIVSIDQQIAVCVSTIALWLREYYKHWAWSWFTSNWFWPLWSRPMTHLNSNRSFCLRLEAGVLLTRVIRRTNWLQYKMLGHQQEPQHYD